jgi:hypothetical protein
VEWRGNGGVESAQVSVHQISRCGLTIHTKN